MFKASLDGKINRLIIKSTSTQHCVSSQWISIWRGNEWFCHEELEAIKYHKWVSCLTRPRSVNLVNVFVNVLVWFLCIMYDQISIIKTMINELVEAIIEDYDKSMKRLTHAWYFYNKLKYYSIISPTLPFPIVWRILSRFYCMFFICDGRIKMIYIVLKL